tara:strand:- start:175 stop:330 length:156 start_codon:yes stop_codon:yes gene_type:complete
MVTKIGEKNHLGKVFNDGCKKAFSDAAAELSDLEYINLLDILDEIEGRLTT